MKIPHLKKKSELKSCHNVTWEDNYSWIHQEIVNRDYQKIQKKIHPDISPETSRLSAIVNEAKEIVLKDIS